MNKISVAISDKAIEDVQIYIIIIVDTVNHLEKYHFLKDKSFGKYGGIAFAVKKLAIHIANVNAMMILW